MKHDHLDVIELKETFGLYYATVAMPSGDSKIIVISKEDYDRLKVR